MKKTPVGISIVDADRQTFINANEKFCDTTGYSEEELKNLSVQDITHPEDWKKELQLIQKYSDKKIDDYIIEKRYICKNGDIRWVRVQGESLLLPDSNVQVAIACAEDITDQKEALNELNIRNQISEIFLNTPDEKMYNEVMQVVLQAMESPLGTFAYIDENGNRVVPSVSYTYWDICGIEEKITFFPKDSWGNNIWARCLNENESVVSNGPFQIPEGHIPITRALATPIIHKGKAIGNFIVANKSTDYSEKDVELLETVANIVAPILYSRLRNERYEKERIASESRLKESEERYRSLFDHMGSGVAIYDVIDDGEDFVFIGFNKAAEKIDNQKKEELIGRSIFGARPGVIEFGLIDVFREVWRTGKPQHFPITLYQDDRLTGWYDNFVYRLPTGEIVAIFDDLTVVKQADKVLKESKERLRQIFDNVTAGIVMVDPETHIIIDANQTAASAIGAPIENIIGKNCHEFMCPVEKGNCPVTDLGQNVENAERLLLTIEGREIPILKTVSRVMVGDKEVLLESFIDISEMKRIESERQKLEQQLQQTQKMEAIGALAGGIAHDFNNILFPLVGFTEMLQDELPADSPHHEWLEEILGGGVKSKRSCEANSDFQQSSGKRCQAAGYSNNYQGSVKTYTVVVADHHRYRAEHRKEL